MASLHFDEDTFVPNKITRSKKKSFKDGQSAVSIKNPTQYYEMKENDRMKRLVKETIKKKNSASVLPPSSVKKIQENIFGKIDDIPKSNTKNRKSKSNVFRKKDKYAHVALTDDFAAFVMDEKDDFLIDTVTSQENMLELQEVPHAPEIVSLVGEEIGKAVRRHIRENTKARTLKLREERKNKETRDYVPETIVDDIQNNVKGKSSKNSTVYQYTREEKRALVESNLRRKAYKKEKKKERQAARRMAVIVNSSGLQLETGIEHKDESIMDISAFAFREEGPKVGNKRKYAHSFQDRMLNWLVTEHPRTVALAAIKSSAIYAEVGDLIAIYQPLYLLLTSTSRASFANSLAVLLRSVKLPIDVIESTLISQAISFAWKALCAVAKTTKSIVYRLEGGVAEALDWTADFLDKGLDMGSAMIHGTVFKTVKDLVLMLATYHFFPPDLAEKAFTYLGEYDGPKTFQGMASKLLRIASTVLTMSSRYLKGEITLSTMFTSQDPFYFHLNRMRDLVLKEKFLQRGVVQPGFYDEVTWYTEAKETYDYLFNKRKSFAPITPERKEVDRNLDIINNRMVEIQARNSSQRAPPLTFVLHSTPGVGKSSLLNFIFAQCSIAMGRKFTTSMVFHRNAATDYWDTYDPNCMPYIHLPEIGSMRPEIVVQRGDSRLDEFLALADSSAFPVNMAQAHLKNKIFATPEAIAVDTNVPFMNIDAMFQNKAAFLRRGYFIQALVKDQFRMDGSSQLDPEKCALLGGDPFDRWWFTVVSYQAKNNVEVKTIKHLEKADCYALASFIQEKMVAHQLQQKKVVEFVENPNTYEGYANRDELKVEAGIAVSYDIRSTMQGISSKAIDIVHSAAGAVNILAEAFKFWTLFCVLKFAIGTELHSHVQRSVFKYLSAAVLLGSLISLNFQTTLILGVLFVVCYEMLPVVSAKITRAISEGYYVKAKIRVEQFLTYIGYNKGIVYDLNLQEFLVTYRLEKLITAIALVGTLGTAVYLTNRKDEVERHVEASTEFVVEHDSNPILNQFEEKTGCTESYKRIANNLVSSWNVQEVSVKNKHTSSLSDLQKRVVKNVRAVQFIDTVRKKKWTQNGLGLKGNLLLLNTHGFKDMQEGILKVGCASYALQHDQYSTVSYDKHNRFDLGNDLTIVCVSGMSDFSDITQHLYDGTVLDNVMLRGMIEGTPVNVLVGGPVIADQVKIDKHLQYNYSNHRLGLCGTPVLVSVKNRGSILGIHFAGGGTAHSAATIFTKQHFEDFLRKYESNQFVVTASEPCVEEAVKFGVDATLALESSLEEPSSKSPLRYVHMKRGRYYGKLPGQVMLNNRSNLIPNIYASRKYGVLEQLFHVYQYIPSTIYGIPMMKPTEVNGQYVSPYNVFLEKINFEEPEHVWDHGVLLFCVEHYVEHVYSQIKDKIPEKIGPITMKAAINGVAYDAFIRRISMSKAGGFGFTGSKLKHVVEVDENVYEPEARLKEAITRSLSLYLAGERAGTVYKAQLKDEPRNIEKIKTGATRVFFSSSFGDLIISRMYLSPIYSLLVQFGTAFGTAIGIDMHRRPNDLVDRLQWKDTIMAGDFGSYDITLPYKISFAATLFIEKLAQKLGYNDQALKVVRGILSDSLHPMVEINKDLFEFPGLQPSGKYATAEDNSVKNVLLLMYAWYMHPVCKDYDFFEHNRPVVFGDDVNNSVDPKLADHFNDLYFTRFCKDVYGMKYTNSEKGEVVLPFTPFEDVVFLKRRYRWDQELNRYIAPLEMDSIAKTLLWRIPSGAISDIEQVISMTVSVLYELWFHSTIEKYDQMREYFAQCLEEEFGQTSIEFLRRLPTYAQLLSTYSGENTVNGEERDERFDPEEITTLVSLLAKLSCSNEQFQGCGFSLDRLDPILRSANTYNLIELRKLLIEERDSLELKQPDDDSEVKQRIKELDETIQFITARLNKLNSLQLQSGAEVEMKVGTINNEEKFQTLTDSNLNRPVESKSQIYGDSIMEETDLELNEFFMRPVQVLATAIPNDTEYFSRLDIWDLWSKVPSIRAKLKNFAYLTAKLHVKITVSGTPFHAGKLLASYVPLPDYVPAYNQYIFDIGNLRSGFKQFLTQQKCSKVLDVKLNTPVELEIDYFSPSPMARLYEYQNTVLTDTSSYTTLSRLGCLNLLTLNTVTNVSSGSTTNVYVYVYAYATEVRLGCPTATVISLTTETGDEREIGPMEKIMKSSAELSKDLSVIPSISPLAKASQMCFTHMGNLAAYFGWSKPSLITEPQLMKNEPFRNGAQAVGSETNKRVTLDPKQELLLNPFRDVLEDEMSYKYLCSREGLLTTFTWSTTNTPNTGPVWAMGVSPVMGKPYYSLGDRYWFQPTPLAMVANMHQFWNGSIKFRFEIVCTGFHRGKFAVVFEPNVSQYALTQSVLNLNKQYTFVGDLQDTQDFEVCVDMAYPREWIPIIPMQGQVLGGITRDTTMPCNVSLASYLNGFLAFWPLTALQSPNGGSIKVNVYVSSDDINFNQVTSANYPTLVLQSGPEVPYTCVELNQARNLDSRQSERHFGEQPYSFREVLKRYSTVLKLAGTLPSNNEQYSIKLPLYPWSPLTPTTLGGDYQLSMFSLLRYCYLGIRGGMKYRLIVLDLMAGEQTLVKCALDAPNTISFTNPEVGYGNTNSLMTMDGAVEFYIPTNGGIEVEIPNYDPNLFGLSQRRDVYADTQLCGQHVTRSFRFFGNYRVSSDRTVEFEIQSAIGEDFNFLYFVGAFPYTVNIAPAM